MDEFPRHVPMGVNAAGEGPVFGDDVATHIREDRPGVGADTSRRWTWPEASHPRPRTGGQRVVIGLLVLAALWGVSQVAVLTGVVMSAMAP